MSISIIAVGKIKQAGFRDDIDDYLLRIRRYTRFEEIEIKEGVEKEVISRFQKAMKDCSTSIALEIDGKTYSSQRFARLMAECESKGKGRLCFLIGGSDGLPKRISDIADVKLSLSPMTFSHRLARLVLVEQIYRGFTILKNEPYSKH